MADFTPCLSFTLAQEGGFVNDPRDPGGATNMGITQHTLDAYTLAAHQPRADVRKITRAAAMEIYNEKYWAPIHGGSLPAGVDLVVFDYAVNSGVAKASIELQDILGVAADGAIGQRTLDAVHKFAPETTIHTLCNWRLAFLHRLSTWSHFGAGWTRRVNECQAAALKLAQGAH